MNPFDSSSILLTKSKLNIDEFMNRLAIFLEKIQPVTSVGVVASNYSGEGSFIGYCAAQVSYRSTQAWFVPRIQTFVQNF